MRIVSLEVFRTLPKGTLFATFHNEEVGRLQIKGHTQPHSYEVLSFEDCFGTETTDWREALYHAADTGEAVPVNLEDMGEQYQLEDTPTRFAVWDVIDVAKLIRLLWGTYSSVLPLTEAVGFVQDLEFNTIVKGRPGRDLIDG